MEKAATELLEGGVRVDVDQYIDPRKDGLKNRGEVIENIQNIIADIFAKDEDLLRYLSRM